MTPAFPTRRRAEQFDSLVEAPSTGAVERADVPEELARLASVATALREVPRVEPRPEFSSALRERLMVAAAQELTAGEHAPAVDRLTVRTPGPRTRERRLSAVVGALAVVGATGSMAVASQGALPGDTLYPIKRTLEDVRAGFTVGNDAKGAALLAQADNRLAEVSELSERDRPGREADLERGLEEFSEHATAASDLLLTDFQQNGDVTSVEDLRVFAAESIDELSRLEAVVPSTVRGALAEAATTLLTIDQAAANACPSCTEGGITALPSSLVDLVAGSLPVVPAKPQDAGSGTDEKAKEGGHRHGRHGGQNGAGSSLAGSRQGPAEVPPPAPTPPVEQPRGGETQPRGGEQKLGPQKPSIPQPSTPPAPAPTSVGEVVGGVVDGVGEVVDGVGGTVNGVLKVVGGVLQGILGTPTPEDR